MVTYYRRTKKAGTVVALAFGYRPELPPSQLASTLEDIAVNW